MRIVCAPLAKSHFPSSKDEKSRGLDQRLRYYRLLVLTLAVSITHLYPNEYRFHRATQEIYSVLPGNAQYIRQASLV